MINENAWVLCSDLYDAYKEWAEAEGERPKGKRWLWPQLERRGIGRDQLTTGSRDRFYTGIGLATEERN